MNLLAKLRALLAVDRIPDQSKIAVVPGPSSSTGKSFDGSAEEVGASWSTSDLTGMIREAQTNATSKWVHVTFGDFPETVHGHPGVEEKFDAAIAAASTLLGHPRKAGFGPGHKSPDVEGVPQAFFQYSLRYAWWDTAEVQASIVMLSHDADTVRSFELRLKGAGKRAG